MTAHELIKQVASLPGGERTLFRQLFHGMTADKVETDTATNGPLTWPDFGDRLRSIYGARVAPDSAAIIDEGRGAR